jgi:FtsP/CotA-like multicopper oxidase with cupredoxin domain
MSRKRLFTLLKVATALTVVSWGVEAAFAQKAAQQQTKKITQKERKAAAMRARTRGFALTAGAAALPGGAPRYFSHPNYANSPLPMGTCSAARTACFSDTHCPVGETCQGRAGGIRKFVDRLPGLGAAAANNLGQYIPVATPGVVAVPTSSGGSVAADYYEIELGEYTEKMHSDLPPTKLRGYRQTGPGSTTPFHYLGPAIVATKDKPVVIKFTNSLPAGEGGNLFLPVDSTVMGSGMGPLMGGMTEENPQKPMCSEPGLKNPDCYSENRATLHLHGGITPWISDGTPHQWITPAGEPTSYPQGVSVKDVPGLNLCEAPDDGCQTFYYTNQQSARLLFYHDHAWGITRLNVYAGEAAPYVITDATEAALTAASGPLAGVAATIPLVIQDKTFVPSAEQLALQDETWDTSRWGGLGGLWLPHVYSPAQNPGDSGGVNMFGRWAYGPWFWPPTQSTLNGPIANPYWVDASQCDPNATWCEPPLVPGTPFLSMGMESFHDTPIVNGTAYPYVSVPAGPVRFRILNAANDRFFNLSLYLADNKGSEVELNPAEVAAALDDPAGVFPTPVAGKEGPSWVQIGTEGGFLPAPVVIPPQFITWVTDPTVFNAGNVDKHSLLLGPAERADVIVDFSAFRGKTLILYNDAPAAFPARDPRYDYYTGNAELTDTGGVSSTLPGYGPNTRTVMQIRVSNTRTGSFNLASLQSAFAHKADGTGVFESSQDPIIVGQGGYNSAYGTAFQNSGPAAGLVQIHDTSFSFKTLAGGANGPFLTFGLQPKMIQDEMGEAFDREYGRMSGFLGVEAPNPQAGLQNMILYPYVHPPTEVLKGVEVPGTDTSLQVTRISSTDDGTQIWKITHNGVDTHPVHFHLYLVQLINRVGWDGIIRKPDLNELGWKDTIRVSPLEDTIVAVRPIVPHVPFDLPNSTWLLHPALADGALIESATAADQQGLPLFSFNPDGEPIDIYNHEVNFGWEYVWHCHILSHEEMDMMRSQAVGVVPWAPAGLTATVAEDAVTVALSWQDNSANETSFVVQRADAEGFTGAVQQHEIAAGSTSYTDTITPGQPYFYRVLARNLVGDTHDYSDAGLNELPPGGGFPTLAMDSAFSNVAWVNATPVAPDAPASVTATLEPGPRITLAWPDVANESSYEIQRSANGAAFSPLVSVAADTIGFSDTAVSPGNAYQYQVRAVNTAGASAFTAGNQVQVPDNTPAAPSGLSGTAAKVTQGAARVVLIWIDNSNNETGFEVQRATNLNFTANLASATLAANTTTFDTGTIARKTTFYFRVRAVNLAGNSAWSNTFVVTTP